MEMEGPGEVKVKRHNGTMVQRCKGAMVQGFTLR